jgi:maleate isomerase
MFTHMTGHNNTISTTERAQSHESREYGRNGLFGILTPQGNPTVEPELGILLPAGSAMLSARSTSASPSLRERLIDYGEALETTVSSFGDIVFDAIGFACTGSSYLFDPRHEQRILESVENVRGCAVITAAQAVADALESLAIRRIALLSPYPEWLTAACRAHWEGKGFVVTAVLQMPASGSGGGHGIYALTTPTVLKAARAFQTENAQAILITGTGMPSLRTILTLEAEQTLPVLSSNLCLAWSLAQRTGVVAAGPESRLYGGWRGRLPAP